MKTKKDYPIPGFKVCLLSPLGITIWASLHAANFGWFRLFGIGLKWKHESCGLSFSERNGHQKYIKIGKWIIGYLRRGGY